MTITADSFTEIESHNDLAMCYRWNQLDCKIRCHTRALLEKHIADVSSLSALILCSFLVKKRHSMLGEHEP